METRPAKTIAPCPFCGHDDLEVNAFPWVRVQCRTCGAEGPEVPMAAFWPTLEPMGEQLTDCLAPAVERMWEERPDRGWVAGGSLSCPFCGGSNVKMESDYDETNHGWRFGCDTCHAWGPMMWDKSNKRARKLALDAWNGRMITE